MPLPASFLIAAGTAPVFFSEIAVLLVVSALVAYVCHRLGIMPIVSFLIAGALIGPHALGVVQDEALIEAAAEVGVILLLFTIGIEFSLEKLARIKRLIFIGGGLQVVLVVAIVTGLLRLFEVGWAASIFTGFLVALSSTAIVMKLLMDRGETNTAGGQGALGVLIFQDLAVVAMVLLVPMLGGEGGTSLDLAIALGKAVGIVVLVLVVARRVMPKVLEAVARTCSQEIFLLTVVAICFGTAWLTSLAGVSLSLGAFLAGLVISESRFSEMAFGEILPLQILFSATFFVSVGLLLDLGFLIANPLLILAIIGGVLVLKVLTTFLSIKVLRYTTGTAAFTGLMLAQVGEFSFVLERAGREVGLFPAGIENGGPQAFIAATVVLMIATPFLATLGERLRARFAQKAKDAATKEAMETADEAPAHGAIRDHVIIAGYGEAGRKIARVLQARDIPYCIVTLSPEGAREAEAAGLHVISGNYTRQHELTLAGVRHARLLLVADDDLETTLRVVRSAHVLNPGLRVMASTRFEEEIEELQEAGASDAVAEEQESIVRLLTCVLEAYDIAPEHVRNHQQALRAHQHAALNFATRKSTYELSDAQQQTSKCAHTDQTQIVTPSAFGCEECLEMGDTWVHLRICMTCGHVGCCDSSKNKHATKHHHATDHPIVMSFEPGEEWAWCYEDRTTF